MMRGRSQHILYGARLARGFWRFTLHLYGLLTSVVDAVVELDDHRAANDLLQELIGCLLLSGLGAHGNCLQNWDRGLVMGADHRERNVEMILAWVGDHLAYLLTRQ